MADITIDENELAALRLAAKFVLEYADNIDHDTQFYARRLRIETPSATAEAENLTWKNADQIRKDLDAVVTALEGAGIDA